MNTMFVVLLMVFCHIVDDYYLQGWLASAKQKSWWKKNAPHPRYKYDYKWALLMHSFSWSFMTMLPIAFVKNFNVDVTFLIVFVLNVLIHAKVDNLKANRQKINLWQDQLVHMLQLAVTAIILL